MNPETTLPLGVPVEVLDVIAERVADHLAERIAPPPEPYVDVDQAAAYLSAPKSRVYELVSAGRLAHYREGRRLLFRREDLDAAVERVEARP